LLLALPERYRILSVRSDGFVIGTLLRSFDQIRSPESLVGNPLRSTPIVCESQIAFVDCAVLHPTAAPILLAHVLACEVCPCGICAGLPPSDSLASCTAQLLRELMDDAGRASIARIARALPREVRATRSMANNAFLDALITGPRAWHSAKATFPGLFLQRSSDALPAPYRRRRQSDSGSRYYPPPRHFLFAKLCVNPVVQVTLARTLRF